MEKLLKQYREDLHQIPELSMKEFKTKEYLLKELISLGYNPIEVLDTGLLVYIDNGNNETIAFRADMDALPVTEETTGIIKSKHLGNMHACGHDGHMSMLLGFANYLSDKSELLKKNILLIFQPAEESIGGAKQIVETKVLSKYNVKAIFGIHLFPDLEEGYIGSKPGEFMAMASEINIDIYGKSAHVATPEAGINSNIILSKILLDISLIKEQMKKKNETVIISFGKISGGTVRNVISDYSRLEGTVRTFSEKVFNEMITNVKDICHKYELEYNCKIDIEADPGYKVVNNDESLFTNLKNAAKDFKFHEFKEPFMMAEDFSFYQEAVKGIFFYVGTKNEELGYTASLHNPKFNFDSKVLNNGLKAYISLLKEMEIV